MGRRVLAWKRNLVTRTGSQGRWAAHVRQSPHMCWVETFMAQPQIKWGQVGHKLLEKRLEEHIHYVPLPLQSPICCSFFQTRMPSFQHDHLLPSEDSTGPGRALRTGKDKLAAKAALGNGPPLIQLDFITTPVTAFSTSPTSSVPPFPCWP